MIAGASEWPATAPEGLFRAWRADTTAGAGAGSGSAAALVRGPARVNTECLFALAAHHKPYADTMITS